MKNLKSIKKRVLTLWHDIYYLGDTKFANVFALRCKDVTEKMDLNQIPKLGLARLRFYLHLSVCEACRHYYGASKVLQGAAREFMRSSQDVLEDRGQSLNKLNQRLLERLSK